MTCRPVLVSSKQIPRLDSERFPIASKSLSPLEIVLDFADMDGKNAGEVTRRVNVGHDDTNPNEPTRRRERRLLVKIDLFVLPTVILLYLMCFIDRTNIGNFLLRVSSLPIY